VLLDREIIHYCHGEPAWNKRWYLTPEDAPKVWDPPFQPAQGTVLYELFSQLRAAGEFYRNPYFNGWNGQGKMRAKLKST
jgi:hypothetical protein